jgi:hypothetical protein
MLDTVARERDRELPFAIGARCVVLANNQIVPGIRLLEIEIIHPLLQNKLELLDDRRLVCHEKQATLTKIEERYLAQWIAKRNPTAQDPMGLGCDLAGIGQGAGGVVARVGLADVRGEWADQPFGIAFRRWE